MTGDLLTAALDQLAAHREQLSAPDAREARHFAALAGLQFTQLAGTPTTFGRALAGDAGTSPTSRSATCTPDLPAS